MRAEAGGPPADVEDAAELRLVRFEFRPALERIADCDRTQVVDGQGLALRLDFELDVTVGAPPQRAEEIRSFGDIEPPLDEIASGPLVSAAELPDVPLLVVCVTRPELLERRPAWGEGATRL